MGDQPSEETLSIRHGDEPRTFRPGTEPREIGPYRLLQVLGEGGMGIVYLAEQTRPVHRRVALKIIKLGMDTRQVIARFETEREALALMNHPNVAKVFDAGVAETGRPYFVMEYVPGIPITDYCDKHRLNTEERLRLFLDVCNAIQHAHQKGIIHRDIKPSNVLVAIDPSTSSEPRGFGPRGPAEMPGQVKVIDFGVAKATQHRLTERTLFTEQGQLIGTPGYMSPEQAEMTALDIDTRTDIYSLGVLLYELLVGALPFDPNTLLAAGFAEVQRIIREVEPPKPSTKLSSMRDEGTRQQRDGGTKGQRDEDSEPRAPATRQPPPLLRGDSGRLQHEPGTPRQRHSAAGSQIDDIAHRRHTEPKTLIRQIRGDLDWIVMRCLEKDRARRYGTANGLAMELQRYLNREPVLAGPPGATYRLGKYVRRNRATVLAAVAFFLAILTGAIVSTRMYLREKAVRAEVAVERDQALEAEAEARARKSEAEKTIQFLQEMLSQADPGQALGQDVTVRDVLDRAARKLESGALNAQPVAEAALRTTIGVAYRALGLYDPAERHIRIALAIRRRCLGERHASVAESSLTLGMVLMEKGDYESAGPFIQDGVSLQPDAASGVPASTLNLEAAAALNRGDLNLSERLYRKDLELLTARRGVASSEVADAMSNLGVLLCRKGEFEEAEMLYTKALDIRRRTLDPRHPDIADSLHALGDLFVKRDMSSQAEPLLREALEFRKVLREHWRIPLIEASLGECLIALGRYAEAEALLLSSYPEISRVQGEDNRLYTAEVLKAIVKLYDFWHAAEPGKGYAEKAAEWRAKLDALNAENPKSQNDETKAGTEARPTEQEGPTKHEGER